MKRSLILVIFALTTLTVLAQQKNVPKFGGNPQLPGNPLLRSQNSIFEDEGGATIFNPFTSRTVVNQVRIVPRCIYETCRVICVRECELGPRGVPVCKCNWQKDTSRPCRTRSGACVLTCSRPNDPSSCSFGCPAVLPPGQSCTKLPDPPCSKPWAC